MDYLCTKFGSEITNHPKKSAVQILMDKFDTFNPKIIILIKAIPYKKKFTLIVRD
jgi:hypothetical protein